MKRRSLLYGIVILVSLLLPLNTPILFGASLPVHVDPLSFDQEPVDAESLFKLYELALKDAANEDYNIAIEDLRLGKLIQAKEDLAHSLYRFEELFRSDVTLLNLTFLDMNVAMNLLGHLNGEEAIRLITGSLQRLNEANSTLIEIDSVSKMIGVQLNSDPAVLLGGTDMVRDLIERYWFDLEGLRRQAEEPYSGLSPTEISIEVGPQKVVTGSSVEVNGSLTDERGIGLSRKWVDILVDYSRRFSVETDRVGRFKASLDLANLYTENVLVTAEYWPDGRDMEVYRPSTSVAFRVDLIFITPERKLSAPQEVHPGKTFDINGTIEANGEPVDGIYVYFLTLGKNSYLLTGPDGWYEFRIRVEDNWAERLEPLQIYTASNGAYAESSKTVNISVTRIPVHVKLDNLVIITLWYPFTVSGSISSDGKPLKNCSVELVLGSERLNVKTSTMGAFISEFKGSPPINTTMYSTNFPLIIRVKPAEPWYKPSNFVIEILFVKPLTLTCAVLLLLCTIWYSWRKFSTRLKSTLHEAGLSTPSLGTMIEFLNKAETMYKSSTTLQHSSDMERSEVPTLTIGESKPKPSLITGIHKGIKYGGSEHIRKKFFLIITLICTVVYLVGLIPWHQLTSGEYQGTPKWHELTDLCSTVKPIRIQSLNDLDGLMLDPCYTTLLMIGPSRNFTREDAGIVRNFVGAGGRVVLADDFGSGNELLTMLNLGVRFDGRLMMNPLFKERNRVMPIAYTVDWPTYGDRLKIVMNCPTVITSPWISMAWPLDFSYLSRDGSSPEESPGGQLALLSEVIIGKGSIYLVSDPSIFINGMLEAGDNRKVLESLVFGSEPFYFAPSPSYAVIDESHSLPLGLKDFNKNYALIYQFLDSIEAKLISIAILVLITFWLIGIKDKMQKN